MTPCRFTLHRGDAADVLKTLDADSVDAIVTDPPAGIAFMNKQWDAHAGRAAFIADLTPIFAECLRVAKPGAHALVWAIPRTQHWTMTALEDAGWEVREVISHIFNTGFPKSLNCGDGLGTALKPAHEAWILCRKPLIGTVAKNVLAHGTGALNIDACRVMLAASEDKQKLTARSGGNRGFPSGSYVNGNNDGASPPGWDCASGRFPPNLVFSHAEGCERGGSKRVPTGVGHNRDGAAHTIGYGGGFRADTRDVTFADADGLETVEAWSCAEGCPVAELDRQSGTTHSSARPRNNSAAAHNKTQSMGRSSADWQTHGHADSGGASRFFPVFAAFPKASTHDRSIGIAADAGSPRNPHPTVKHSGLMDWLCRLITPPGGAILDPFMGSGSTGVAAMRAGFRFVGIERDETYFRAAQQRIAAETHLFGPPP